MNACFRATLFSTFLLAGLGRALAMESSLREGRYLLVTVQDEPKDGGASRLNVAEVEIRKGGDGMILVYEGCPQDHFAVQVQGGGFVITVASPTPLPRNHALSTAVFTGSIVPTEHADSNWRYDGQYAVHTPWGAKSGIFALIREEKP
jgi:hypothetical protein